MTQYLIQIQQMADGTEPKGIFAYEDENECLSAFYMGVSSSIANPNVKSFIFEILDKYGTCKKIERWYRQETTEE